jgi:steroid delta-isomerase-like uncharacterized protein
MVIKTILAVSVLAASAALMPGNAVAGSASAQEINAQRFNELVAVVFNRGDIGAAEQFFHTSLIEHAPWPGHSADVAGFKAGLAELRKSFPDLHMTVERTIAQGDLVVAHMTMSGSQLGEFMGSPASGKTVSIEVIDIVRMTDGRIAEHWGIMDAAGMAGQLGL